MRRVGSGSKRSAAFAAVTRTLYRFGRSVNTRPLRRHTWKCTNEIYKYIHGSTKTRERGTGKGLGPLNGEIAVQRHLSGFRGCLSPRPTKPAPVPRIHRFPQKTNPAPPEPPSPSAPVQVVRLAPCGLLASLSIYGQKHKRAPGGVLTVLATVYTQGVLPFPVPPRPADALDFPRRAVMLKGSPGPTLHTRRQPCVCPWTRQRAR